MKNIKALYVLCDGGRARFIQRRPDDKGFQEINLFESAALHTPSRNLGTDRPGRTQESGTTARHAIQPATDPHEEEKKSFASFAAREIQQAHSRGDFNALVVAAPPGVLQIVLKSLDPVCRKTVVDTLQKDLTKTPLKDLEHILPPLRAPIV